MYVDESIVLAVYVYLDDEVVDLAISASAASTSNFGDIWWRKWLLSRHSKLSSPHSQTVRTIKGMWKHSCIKQVGLQGFDDS